MVDKLRTVKLYGRLKEVFQESYKFRCSNLPEIFRALCTQIDGFTEEFRKGEYQIILDEYQISDDEILTELGDTKEIHIIPVPVGSKNNGVAKVLLGIACIGIGFAVGAHVAAGGHALLGVSKAAWLTMGAGMLMNGIGQMVSPAPAADSNEDIDSRPSYMFNGALNVAEEGNYMPVAYGAPWCGSLVISSGYSTDDVEQTLGSVTGLTATAYNGYIRLSFNKVEGASEYIIRYGMISDNTEEAAKEITWTQYQSQAIISAESSKINPQGSGGYITYNTSYMSDGWYKIIVKARNGSTYSTSEASTTVNVYYSYSDYSDWGDGD